MRSSKKKKIELYKNCKKKLKEYVDNWKETLGSEEETLFGKLKETAMNEKTMKKLGSQRIEEEKKPKPEIPKKVSTLETKMLMSSEVSMETLNVLQITDLISVKPVQPSCVKVFVQLSNLKITKPQQVYSSIAAEARTEPVAGPAHQWEKRCGDGDEQGRPWSQWGKRNVQNN